MNTGGLVEPEGTNAGSAASTAESPHAAGDVLGGGDAADAPDRGEAAPGAPEEDELAGTAAELAGEPGQEHGSSGQDAGSMDPG